MIMELFPDPRCLTDQEIRERIDCPRALIGDLDYWSAIGLLREQQRRTSMTSHDRIALARSLAEERAR